MISSPKPRSALGSASRSSCESNGLPPRIFSSGRWNWSGKSSKSCFSICPSTLRNSRRTSRCTFASPVLSLSLMTREKPPPLPPLSPSRLDSSKPLADPSFPLFLLPKRPPRPLTKSPTCSAISAFAPSPRSLELVFPRSQRLIWSSAMRVNCSAIGACCDRNFSPTTCLISGLISLAFSSGFCDASLIVLDSMPRRPPISNP